MNDLLTILGIFGNVSTLLASIGLVLATSSFISGLQLVRGNTSPVEGKIHRLNGYTTFSLYIVLAALSFALSGPRVSSLLGWPAGFAVVLTKIWIVKRKRNRRAFKYVSWIGATLILVWLFIVYAHIPI
jgi:energy-coupling factor transporter transmembrane protein EcfT